MIPPRQLMVLQRRTGRLIVWKLQRKSSQLIVWKTGWDSSESLHEVGWRVPTPPPTLDPTLEFAILGVKLPHSHRASISPNFCSSFSYLVTNSVGSLTVLIQIPFLEVVYRAISTGHKLCFSEENYPEHHESSKEGYSRGWLGLHRKSLIIIVNWY